MHTATTTPALTEFWAELQRRVIGSIKTDLYSRILYSTDASIYKMMPLGVFFPKHRDEIQAAVELAANNQVPVLMRGAGSSLAGQCVNEALVIDTSRHLNQIIDINQTEKWVKVQPGLVLDHLNDQLKPLGLLYGPDPASSNRATLGGIVSNNSTGSHSIVYGMTADHVIGLSAVLSDGSLAQFGAQSQAQIGQFARKSGLEGQIYSTLFPLINQGEAAILNGTPHHWRRCGGYNLDRLIQTDTPNLAQLICGGEGTLCAIQDLTLNLVDRPQITTLGIVHFDEMKEALKAVPQILETDPSAVELMDNLGLTMCREVPEYARLLTFLEGQPNTILITEYTGTTAAEVKDKLDKLIAFLKKRKLGTTCVRAESVEQQANVWKVRKVGLGLLMSVKGDHKPIPFIEDAAVPVAHLAEYIHKVEDFCRTLKVKVAYYGHASAGCLHVRPLINLKQADQAHKMKQIAEVAADLIAGYGGALSSEHGDGRVRSWLNEHFFGPDLYALYQGVKQIFDPHNLLNPANIVNPGPVEEHLRYGSTYQVIELTEHLDFSPDQGFHRAVEMCNGAGVCRKESDTMCPSYMVTRNEEHATRGRANLLRAALSGDLPRSELTSPRMYAAMDLCVACKACKAECPSSVDMAKIKTEFLAHYYTVHPLPWRSRLFAHIATLSRLGSGMMAPLANWSVENKALRWGMSQVLGIAPQRTLPTFAPQPFTTWFKERASSPSTNLKRKPLVLFNDTFNTYNQPHIAIAATEVLEALGYRLILPGHHCCGRPMISKGLVPQAKALAAQTVAKLSPYVREGIPLVGLEPSCISALKDDYLALLPQDPMAQKVAQAALTFEEFIAQEMEKPDFALPLKPIAPRLLLHGHCHQKALIGTEPAHKMLGLLPDCQVDEVNAGCCGMAGSFGYEAEHYDVSVAMAERKLLPAVNTAGPETLIVTAGVSCRHQIEGQTEKRAYHPAEVLRRAMD